MAAEDPVEIPLPPNAQRPIETPEGPWIQRDELCCDGRPPPPPGRRLFGFLACSFAVAQGNQTRRSSAAADDEPPQTPQGSSTVGQGHISAEALAGLFSGATPAAYVEAPVNEDTGVFSLFPAPLNSALAAAPLSDAAADAAARPSPPPTPAGRNVLRGTATSSKIASRIRQTLAGPPSGQAAAPAPLAATADALVARILAHQHLAKILMYGRPDDTFVFFHAGSAFWWASYQGRPREPLVSLQLQPPAEILCHDVAPLRGDAPQVVLGLSTGDILHVAFLSGHMQRLGRAALAAFGAGRRPAVTSVRWLSDAATPARLLASLENGVVLILDRDRPDDAVAVLAPSSVPGWPRCTVAQLAVAPDRQRAALACANGRVVLVELFPPRILHATPVPEFGGVLAVAWSSDGRYLAAGAEDDSVVVIQASSGRVCARGLAHTSFVASVAFDETRNGVYRFASAGLDGRLCLWDYSPSVTAGAPAALVPVATPHCHADALTFVAFRPDALVTACASGRITVWQRPAAS